ncbi:MAG: tRNA1(Val) (adenine(37)-N6)-methyltransferase [Clostridiales bacterium]|jgi:FkbM family methyltransferase|nr:tRNA1(Val) (adenine(37)-N6)-methyltransferase [Clostridiales bacterium]
MNNDIFVILYVTTVSEESMNLDSLGIGGFIMKQSPDYFKLGTDAVLLSEFVKVRKRDRICDLGAGAGAVTILLAARHPVVRISAIEIRQGAAEIMRENISLNNIENRVDAICADLKKIRGVLPAESFDVVVSNPPYLKKDEGFKTEKGELLTARMEIDCTIDDVCAAAAYLLRFGGVFGVVYRPERLADLFRSLASTGLEPKRMRLVQNKPGASPSLVLVEAQKGARPGLKCLPVLQIRDESGAESAEIKRIYCR